MNNTLGSSLNLTRRRDAMHTKSNITKLFDKIYFIRSFEMYEIQGTQVDKHRDIDPNLRKEAKRMKKVRCANNYK